MQKIKFFIGKGGVGKSTVSALSALSLAQNNRNTLLVSMDPAHNQQDIFELRFSEKPMKVTEKLDIIETDIDFWIKKYLKESEEKLQNNYNYQSAFSFKNYFKVLKFSPSVEEYAMLLSLSNILEKRKDKDVIIFDMPPTALSIRFFSLPQVSLKWIDQLIELRKAIQKKKEIISKVKFGNKEIERDKVIKQLNKLDQNYFTIKDFFEKSEINIVLNNDKLSLRESKRLIDKLKTINISPCTLYINKSMSKIDELKDIKQVTLPFSRKELIGIDSLNEFIKINGLIE